MSGTAASSPASEEHVLLGSTSVAVPEQAAVLHRQCSAAALSLQTLLVTKKDGFQAWGILRIKLLN